jgi:phage terminase large subunit
LSILHIDTPRWAVPLLEPKRYKGAKGGRSSGKSNFMAEMLVEEHVRYPDLQSVCIREIQRSLKFSAKKLVEDKIRALGVSHLFEVTLTEIRRIDGHGIIIFQGLQDHTADSIKSLEGFGIAWAEEAHDAKHYGKQDLIELRDYYRREARRLKKENRS